MGALLLTTMFSGLFAVAGALAVLHALARRGHSESFAFPVSFQAQLGDATGRVIALAHIRRINHQIVYLSLSERVPDEEIFELDLGRIGIDRLLRARSIAQQEVGSAGRPEWVFKLCMEPLSDLERDTMDRYLINEGMPEFFLRFGEEPKAAFGEGQRAAALRDDFPYLSIRPGIV